MGEGYEIGKDLGSSIARGVIEWKQIQLQKKQRQEFDGVMGLVAQRRAMIKSAAGLEDAAMIQQFEAQIQRSPTAAQGERPNGNVREDGSPETEQVIRTPEGDISLEQLKMLKQRKRQAESMAELAEVDLILETQSRFPDNPLVKQWVASNYLAIQQKKELRAQQIAQGQLQLATATAELERRKYEEAPERQERAAATENALGMQRDAARIEAEKRASIEVEGVKAQNATPKAPTESQGKAANFGRRAEQADKELAGISFDRSTVASGLEAQLPNFMQSEQLQRVTQAERNFINAILRRDSGAVIRDEEFDNYAKQFFPRAGDKEATVQQKLRNRKLAVDALRGEAGFAWDLVPAGDTADTTGGAASPRSPDEVRAAFKAGKISMDQAKQMLKTMGR